MIHIPVNRWATSLVLLSLALGATTPEPRANISLPDKTQLIPIAKPRVDQSKSAADILSADASIRFYEWSEKSGAAVDHVSVLAVVARELNPTSALHEKINEVGLAASSGDQIYCVMPKNLGWRAISFTRWEGKSPKLAAVLGTDFSRAKSFAIVAGDLNAGIWVSGAITDLLEPQFRLRVRDLVKNELPDELTIHFNPAGKIEIYPPEVRVDLKLLLLDPRSRSFAVYTVGEKGAAQPTTAPSAHLNSFGLSEPVELQKPIAVEVSLLQTTVKPAPPIRGSLIRYDDECLTLRAGPNERVLRWIELSPGSAVSLRTQLIDRKKASDWMALGEFAWALGLEDAAKNSFATAMRMDQSLESQINDAKQQQLGWAVAFASSEKFIKSTPTEDAGAIADAREVAANVSSRMKIKFREIQTEHFLIFTDWDIRETEFLKSNLENAYVVVSRQFELPAKQNIFIGKLPVYMFSRQTDFRSYASKLDHFEVNDKVAGYYMGRDDGSGHMAMWKPDASRYGNDTHEAEIQWAYVLTHEFTHAFVARYRTNHHIPTWLNEGIAEMIAGSTFPSARPGVKRKAREMAEKEPSIEIVFEEGVKDGQWYPVMRTLVETMVRADRQAFLQMFNDIKDGQDAPAALKKNYGWDYPALLAAWRQQIKADRN